MRESMKGTKCYTSILQAFFISDFLLKSFFADTFVPDLHSQAQNNCNEALCDIDMRS